MKVLVPYIIIVLPTVSYAADLPGSEYAAPGHYAESMLQVSVKNAPGIKLANIPNSKIATEILSITPVSEVFARQMAKADSATGNSLSENDYFQIYHSNHAMNLIVRYTYTNNDGKKDVFISSALMNDEECSVRYNGYMTISREF